MPAPTPPVIIEAFAVNADPAYIDLIPVTTIDPDRASLDLGFPPNNMTPILAGGSPPFGQDMNGILFMLSSHTVYQQSGQPYYYSASLAAAISGYAVGTLLGMTDGSGVWINTVAANSTDPDAGGAGWISQYSYGHATASGLIGGSTTLTAAQYKKSVIVLSGALVANQTVVLPNTLQTWLIVNACTGAFAVTVKTLAGTGVVVPAGGYASPIAVYGDGTNIYQTFNPAPLPTAVSPTPNTIPLRDNTGRVLSVTPAPLNDTTYAATTEYVQDAISGGIAQTWQAISVTNGGTNTNSTGHPLEVRVISSISGTPGGGTGVTVDGVNISGAAVSGGGSVQQTDAFTVPAGKTWSLSWSGSINSIAVVGLF